MSEIQQPRHRLDRTIFAHSALFEAARTSLRRGRSTEDPNEFLASLVLAAFSFEAYLNFLTQELLPDHSLYKSSHKKLAQILEHIDYSPDLETRPYKSLREIREIRNAIAHATTEVLEETRDGMPPDKIEYPKTAWEAACTLEVAERLVEDVAESIRDLHKHTEVDRGSLGFLGHQGGQILR